MGRRRALVIAAAYLAVLLLPASGVAQPQAGGNVQKLTVRVSDRDRNYVRYVPDNVKPGQPLVIVLHGTFGNGYGMRQDTDYGFEKLANQHGFVVVYPDGVRSAWNDCRKYNRASARIMNIDDVGFLREVIRAEVAHNGTDPAKIFLFGFSGGAHMAYRMAWEAPQEIAAIATVGGNLPPPEALTCMSNGKTPRVLMIKGRADDDPYGGGPHPVSGSVLSAPASAAAFAKQNGVGEGAEEADAAPGMKFLAWPATGRPIVALYSIDGLGHKVPIASRDQHDGPALAWKFFTAP